MILFGASYLYLSEKRIKSSLNDSESKKEALNIVSHFFFCFLLPPVILCLPSLNSPGLSLWAQGTQRSCPDDGEPETQTHYGIIYALPRPPTVV